MTKLEKLLELAAQLPGGLRADWRGTNHFELQAPYEEDGLWWLSADDIHSVISWEGNLKGRDPAGQRLGLIMDIAEAVKAAEPEIRDAVRLSKRQVNVYTRPEFSIDPKDYE
jgi:hypothetical protein